MIPELPKSVRDVLSRQTAGDAHPSADVLTAFAEQALTHPENQRVTEHLARCAECRDVVFLAGSAVEETVGGEQNSSAAAAVPGSAATQPPPRRRSPLRWAWVPALAVVALVSAVLVQRSVFVRPASHSVTMASKAPAPEAPASPPATAAEAAPQPPATAASPKTLAKPARAKAAPEKTSETLASTQIARRAEEYPSAPTVPPSPQPASAPTAALEEMVKSAPAGAPTHNAFVSGEAQSPASLTARQRPPLEKPTMAARAAPPRSQWRVTADGHLERSIAPGSWSAVMADQPTVFRAVSVIGNNVWAGGNGGALFHSSDGGENWIKQPLGAPASPETGAIVSIRFSDSQHGVVTTEGGARWSSSDGGATWTRE